MNWKSPAKDGLPPKPGKLPYEQIPCLAIRKGEMHLLMWNCEHNCWDEQDGDDYMFDPLDVDYYIPLTEIPTPNE